MMGNVKLIQISEAAKQLGVTRQTVENWCSYGLLKRVQMGRAHFVSQEAIDAIADEAAAYVGAASQLHEMTERLRQEKKKTHDAIHDLRMMAKYSEVLSSYSARHTMYEIMVNIFSKCDYLKERESGVLLQLLNGDSPDNIGEYYGLTRGRVYQIANKALRKAKCFADDISDRLNAEKEVRMDNESLRKLVVDLQNKLDMYRKAEEDTGMDCDLEELDRLCTLLNRPIAELGLSARAFNGIRETRGPYGLVFSEIETLGDLIRHSRIDILKRRNVGRKTLTELDNLLESYNLEWSTDVDKIFRERAQKKIELTEHGEERDTDRAV